ncbi:MAG: stage III sporulation protein AB [Clostridia bacterium]|nr:stage III sporulation protein AB [Clostridia bacterium]MBR3575777.1 stage III sporulation protein AB [Clostridia bacterium]
MPVKIAGAIAIIASCTMLGFELSSHLIKRVRILEAWQQVLLRMSGLIRYAKTPLYEIYETFSSEKGEIGEFFTALRKCRGETALNSWKKNIGEMKWLAKTDMEILVNMAKGLGEGDVDEQIKDIEFAYDGITSALDKAKEISARDAKMYRSISFFAGVTVAILLI